MADFDGKQEWLIKEDFYQVFLHFKLLNFEKSIFMGLAQSKKKSVKSGPSTFALLIEDINKMSESQQKLLWLQLNKEKVSLLAKAIDASVVPNSMSQEDIDLLIKEAKQHVRSKKKS